MEIIDSFYNDMIHFDEDHAFEIDNPEIMKRLVVSFIAKKAEGLSAKELLTAFGDRSQLIDDWIVYLKVRIKRLGITSH